MNEPSPWTRVVLFPDSKGDWEWAKRSVVGLPALVRVLANLGRSGVEQVILAPGAERLRMWLEDWLDKKPLPKPIWSDTADTEGRAFLLGVRGGVLFEPDVVHWFRDGPLKGQGAVLLDGQPILFSYRAEATRSGIFEVPPLGPSRDVPEGVFCAPTQGLGKPGDDLKLLEKVGKATDRWHVRWVRRWAFPLIRWLAERGIRPNTITWMGFFTGLVACGLIATGEYWSGVAGAALLYASWVLDCVDGTLARLTFSESRYGQKLDSALGHLTNLMIFSALIWAVYGEHEPWKAGAVGLLVLGGILLAHRLSKKEKETRLKRNHKTSRGRLASALDKINHRDYAVLIFLLALVDGFKWFLWISAVGIHVYWLLSLGLIIKRRKA